MILELRAIDTYYGLGHILHGLSLGVGEGYGRLKPGVASWKLRGIPLLAVKLTGNDH